MITATARDVMNPEVMTVPADMTVPGLAAFLRQNQITGAPVLDERGRLVGVVSLSDIAEADGEEGSLVPDRGDPRSSVREWGERFYGDEVRPFHVEADPRLVRDIMTPTLYTVPEQTPVSTIAKAMVAGRIHRLLVTRDGRVVGIVTSLDLVKLLCKES